ncbi:MAG: sigma-70 family RNA polymerase sigma factor [Gemmatimonadaceae bacterium]
MESTPSEITRLLLELGHDQSGALERLFPVVYDELKAMAAAHLRRERPDHTLSPTALVHEAYLRLVDQRAITWEGRSHFFAIAATAMRRILVDHTRRRIAKKRERRQVTLSTEPGVATSSPSDEVLAVDEALERLAAFDPRRAQLIEMRYFAGFSIEEVSEATGMSRATVNRDWALARAWLQRELSRDV